MSDSRICYPSRETLTNEANANFVLRQVVAVSLHPGTILTTITKPVFVRFSLDTFELAGGVAVWLATENAKFMNGRYMGVNWSVDDLIERETEIVSKGLLLPELQGTFGVAQFENRS
jgi:hypothetical protein